MEGLIQASEWTSQSSTEIEKKKKAEISGDGGYREGSEPVEGDDLCRCGRPQKVTKLYSCNECITLKSKGDKQFRTLKIDSMSWPQLDSESWRSNYTGCHVLSCAIGTEEAELYSLESYLSLLEEENKGQE